MGRVNICYAICASGTVTSAKAISTSNGTLEPLKKYAHGTYLSYIVHEDYPDRSITHMPNIMGLTMGTM